MTTVCYRCHQPGHRSNQCPRRPAVNFVEGNYAEDEEDDQEIEVVDGIEEDGDDDFVGMIARQPCSLQAEKTEDRNWNKMTGNQPPGIEDSREKRLSCIVQRVFLTPKRGPELSTRHQVFRTNALVNEVTAKVVIDTGSSENLVSKDLVKKLKLPTEKHPQPYGLRWIRKVEGAADTVSEVCRVPIAIGKNYKDVVVCDVVMMDACQILLGRPWQYDIDIGFKGKSNTYEFWWKGRQIIIKPPTLKTELHQAEGENFLAVAIEQSCRNVNTGLSELPRRLMITPTFYSCQMIGIFPTHSMLLICPSTMKTCLCIQMTRDEFVSKRRRLM